MKKKVFFIILFSVALALLFSKVVGGVYFLISKPITGFLSPSCPECFDGFILGYLFFVSLILNINQINSKNKIWVISLLPLILFFQPPFEGLIIGVGLIFISWLLAQGVLFIKNKTKKSVV